jgi:tetratricopeptide (TPR) repeat protein
MVYEKKGEYENAIKDYVLARDMAGSYNFVSFRLAYLYTDKHNFEKAIECFSGVIKKDSNEYSALKNRAILYEELPQFEKALEDYTTLIDDGYWDKSVHIQIAKIYIKIDLFDKAIGECNIVMNGGIKLYDKENATVTRGRAYMKKGDMEAALMDFNTAIESDSVNLYNANFHRGLLYLEQEEYEKALQDFSGVNDYSFPEVLEKRRVAYLALGKTKEAEEALESMKKRTEYKSLDRYSRKLFGWIEI